ncbi:CRISPR type III-a/mtube-associated protein csm2 [Firmicutes bacterium M10-2]|nr:CRISPR type III-a/mtube-associated protein csm2 [Firmicutes bacterium M10-2]
MEQYNKHFRNSNSRSDFKSGKNNLEWEKLKKPNKPLSEYYADKEKLLLPEQYAYEVAQKFKPISTSQLRKILSQVKIAKSEAESGRFKEAKNKLFALLPLTAYNVGRCKKSERQKMNPLYLFLKENLKPETLQTEKDIFLFDELFTSIIAYHKYLKGE